MQRQRIWVTAITLAISMTVDAFKVFKQCFVCLYLTQKFAIDCRMKRERRALCFEIFYYWNHAQANAFGCDIQFNNWKNFQFIRKQIHCRLDSVDDVSNIEFAGSKYDTNDHLKSIYEFHYEITCHVQLFAIAIAKNVCVFSLRTRLICTMTSLWSTNQCVRLEAHSKSAFITICSNENQ